MPKVSVIVPVYNVENYLPQCLDSICGQTLSDLQIICVDDGSSDKSGLILDGYAQKDSRIMVIHRKNGGYGAAMNTGLKYAVGEYVGIVESDDKVSPDMYASLYEVARRHDLDFVKSEAFYWFEGIDYLKRVHESSVDGYFNRVLGENDRNLFFDFFMNIWTGIYKRKFILENDIVFHESPGASYQDNGFWMQTCFYARRAMWLNEAYYYYRQDNPEASVKSESKMSAMTKEYEYLEKVLKCRHQEELLPYCYSMKMFRLRGTFYRIADEKKMDFYEQVKADYARYKSFIRYNKYMDNWIRAFLQAPQKLCDNIIFKKNEIVRRVKEANGVIIYGTGKRGDIVLRGFYNEGLYDDIRCFAVSGRPDKNTMALKPVYSIEEAYRKFPEAVFLVAAMNESKAYADIVSRLNELGISSYLDSIDILENYYIL